MEEAQEARELRAAALGAPATEAEAEAVALPGSATAAGAASASGSADPSPAAAAAPRPQDVVGAVSRRAVPIGGSDSDADADGEGGGSADRRRMFGLVDFQDPGAPPAGSGSASGKKKKRSGGRPKRRWCAKEFDTQMGRYTCSTDGMYIVKLAVSGLGDRSPFVSLVHKHALGGTTYDQVDAQTGVAGQMVHLRREDEVSVRLTALPDATGAELRAVEQLGGTLSIELCMRKRKRRDEFAEAGEEAAAGRAASVAGSAARPSGGGSKASRRRERKKRASAPAPTATAAAAPGGDAKAASAPAAASGSAAAGPDVTAMATDSETDRGESDGTGSDTEWSEGFSSDDDERRATRLPKRNLTRVPHQSNSLHCQSLIFPARGRFERLLASTGMRRLAREVSAVTV